MKKALIIVTCILASLAAVAQSHTVSGTVSDAATGETLIGATILDLRSGKGAVSDLNGRFSLTLKGDSVNLRCTFVGYEPQFHTFKNSANTTLNIKLKPSVQLKEVVVSAERVMSHMSSQMSAVDIPIEQIKSVPVLFGEADIVKALQLLPGVQSGNDGNGGFYVRGGGPDENLFLLDGVPIYNVNHLGGFFSAFNADAVKSVTLYKGSFPARFGGRLSSVLDVTSNNGNNQELHGNASIGFISAKLNLEGPLVKEKTTFCLSARRTYADILLKPLVYRLSKQADGVAKLQAGYYFYDLNGKISHTISERSSLFGTFYWGSDYVYGRVRTLNSAQKDEFMGFNNQWGNLIGSLRWNRVLTPKLFMNVTGSYTQYSNLITGSIETQNFNPNGEDQVSTIKGDYSSGIRDITARVDFNYTPNPDHSVKFGSYFTRHWFIPEVISGNVDYYDDIQMNDTWRMDTVMGGSRVLASESVAFIEDDWSAGSALKLNYGLHLSGFYVRNTFYPSLQPRISARLLLADDLSLKVGYAEMTQYMHLLSTTSVSMSTDLWVPATDRITPMRSRQVAAGLFYDWPAIAQLSVEGYYKHMSNIIEYKDGASFFGMSTNWEDLVVAGDGWAYGVELLAERSIGKLTGWIGYTWSHTTHQFNRPGQELNDGEPFPAKYDRRHDFSIVASYKFSDRFDVSATWVFCTGNAATLSMQRYNQAYEDPDDYTTASTSAQGGSLPYIEGRNNFRMPNYHRMDVSANLHRTFKRRNCRRTLNFSVYNLYNRQNPYMIYESRSDTYQGYNAALMQLSIFPILPSVAYTLYF